ncbi:serine/threonine-protein kinase RsbW [Frankia sp. EI5c]|uniref:ATP-binding protein n=1 Tax=Frankia sp. EI5c TaxID=683316 RepID=UPI0007C227E8|nr:ATP-binding protein [Frankia sp. EI5c]OAA18564.1 serine/threonine-protein kinase RsbW [Frankia sp. EI5c]
MEIKLGLSLPRDKISIPLVRRICTQSLSALGVSQSCIDDVELALTEACANVLLHALADDDYEVSVGVDNQVAVIEVVDHGGGFNATEILDGEGIRAAAAALADGDGDGANPSPHPIGSAVGPIETLPEQGRGILLMRALMDSVRFDAVEGPHRGTRVHLEKLLTWNDRSPAVRLGSTHPERGPWSGGG